MMVQANNNSAAACAHGPVQKISIPKHAQNVIGSRISCLTLKGMDEEVVPLCKHIRDSACSATLERFLPPKYEYA